jgi:hypothetical protein
MKNKYWLLGLLLCSPIIVNGQSSEPVVCAQIIKSAVGPSGHCQTFKTPCDIPQDWKMVSSCDAVEDVDFGATPEEFDLRRLGNRWQTFQEQMDLQKEEQAAINNNPYRRIGSASLGRAGIDREPKTAADESPLKKRTVSDRDYYSRKYNNTVDYRRDETISENEWQQNRQSFQTRLRYGSATTMDRNGPISSKPKWFVSSRKHFKDNLGDFSDRWRSSTQILQDEERARQESLQSNITDGPALRKIYTGSRRTGDLEKAIVGIE